MAYFNVTNSKKLEKIAKQIERCAYCKRNTSGLSVPGGGNPNAKIMIVGEAPGREEAKTGRPFVGRSGLFLNTLLKSIELKRKNIFITSPIKYYPGRRTLTKKEILHGRTHLMEQIEAIRPNIIVALGNVALTALFPEKKLSVSKVHGKPIKSEQFICFPTFHPASAMRFPKTKKLTKQDFQRLKGLVAMMRRAQRVSTIIERSAGAVVFRKNKDVKFLILHYSAGHWDFPKGNREPGESEKKTIRREIQEETGITRLTFVKGFREVSRYVYRRGGKRIKKDVAYVLARTTQTRVTLSFEHVGYAWLTFNEAMNRLTYQNSKKVLKSVKKIVHI